MLFILVCVNKYKGHKSPSHGQGRSKWSGWSGLAGPLFLKLNSFYKKQLINKSARVIFKPGAGARLVS